MFIFAQLNKDYFQEDEKVKADLISRVELNGSDNTKFYIVTFTINLEGTNCKDNLIAQTDKIMARTLSMNDAFIGL